MSKIRAITIACWVIVAIVLVGVLVWLLTGNLFGFNTGLKLGDNILSFGAFNFEIMTGPYSYEYDYTVSADSVSTLYTDWTAGKVTVTVYDGDEIRITESAQRELRDGEFLRIDESENKVSIHYKSDNRLRSMPTKHIEVLVPEELMGRLGEFKVDATSANVDVTGISAERFVVETISGRQGLTDIGATGFSSESTSGRITATGVNAVTVSVSSISGGMTVGDIGASSVSCEATSGRIELTDVSADSVSINTISGAITTERVTAGRLDCDSGSGRQEHDGSFDDVALEAISGAVTVRSSVVPQTLHIETTSGRVEIYVPDEGELRVRHESVSGRFSSDIGVVSVSGDAQFKIETISGSISIGKL